MVGLLGSDLSTPTTRSYVENCISQSGLPSAMSNQIVQMTLELWGRWLSLSMTVSHIMLQRSARCLNSTTKKERQRSRW